MAYIVGVIRGEKNLWEYCKLRWHDTPRFVESFGHGLFDGYIERIYEKEPSVGYYTDYYILAMEHPDGTYYDTAAIREDVSKALRSGKQKLIEIPTKKTRK